MLTAPFHAHVWSAAILNNFAQGIVLLHFSDEEKTAKLDLQLLTHLVQGDHYRHNV